MNNLTTEETGLREREGKGKRFRDFFQIIKTKPAINKTGVNAIFLSLLVVFSLSNLSAFYNLSNDMKALDNKMQDKDEIIAEYQATILAMSKKAIIVQLEVEYLNGSLLTVLFDPKTVAPSFNEDGFVDSWFYTFKATGLFDPLTDLQGNETKPVFRYTHFVCLIEAEAFVVFSAVQCKWSVENKFDILRKDSFSSSGNGDFFRASFDITNHLWKDAVPDEVDAEISFRK